MHLEDLMTLTQASRILNVTATTLRWWIVAGRIRAVRDGAGRRLLLREDVERIAKERKRAGVARRAPHAGVK